MNEPEVKSELFPWLISLHHNILLKIISQVSAGYSWVFATPYHFHVFSVYFLHSLHHCLILSCLNTMKIATFCWSFPGLSVRPSNVPVSIYNFTYQTPFIHSFHHKKTIIMSRNLFNVIISYFSGMWSIIMNFIKMFRF